jgi:hypothetical protein
VVWIRFYVGAVFLCEGILKFLRPVAPGTGRFGKAGIPAPDVFASLDGLFEIGCWVLTWVGLFTRLVALPMTVDMTGALAITKLPILWGHAPLFKGESGWCPPTTSHRPTQHPPPQAAPRTPRPPGAGDTPPLHPDASGRACPTPISCGDQ